MGCLAVKTERKLLQIISSTVRGTAVDDQILVIGDVVCARIFSAVSCKRANALYATVMIDSFICFLLVIGASDHILWTAVQTDIDSADVFAADTEHQHDHAADKEHGGHQGAVSHQNRCRMEQFA